MKDDKMNIENFMEKRLRETASRIIRSGASASETISIFNHYLKRLEDTDDDLILVITTCLLTEHIIDKIIDIKVPRGNEILEWTYARKLRLIFSMGLIPEHSFENLRRLANIRNVFAHKLSPIEEDMVKHMLISNPSTPVSRLDTKKISESLQLMCLYILDELCSIVSRDLGVDVAL